MHYVPIVENGDIEHIIKIEREYPGTFASIAEEGRRFPNFCSTGREVLQYVAEAPAPTMLFMYIPRIRQQPCEAGDITLRPQISLRLPQMK